MKRVKWGVMVAGSRVLAALLGTLPPSVLLTAALCRFLPLNEGLRYAIGFASSLPIWVALICIVFLSRSAVRSWGTCSALSASLIVLLYGLPF